jgi:hypothetical protein
MTGRYKPIYVALDTTFGSQGLVLLRTTGVDNSPQLKAFYEICVNAGLYEGQQGLKMLHREARQGYRVLLLVIDGDVRAGALFSLAKQADDPGTMLLDILMLAVAEEYRYTDGTQTRHRYGSLLVKSLKDILRLAAGGKHPENMLARVKSGAEAFYSKHDFSISDRGRKFAQDLKQWYKAAGLTHYANSPSLWTMLYSSAPMAAALTGIAAQRKLIECGAAAYDAATHIPLERHGKQPYSGPTLRNGNVCIMASNVGGSGGRGLFAGPGGVEEGASILYSGELVSALEANRRKESGKADYMLQLGFTDDSDRIDGCDFADAISREPTAGGRYLPLPHHDWANDAGPGCMVNENKGSPNAKLKLHYLEKCSKLDLFPYRVIIPTRFIGAGEEIFLNYGSRTPLANSKDAQGGDASGNRGGGGGSSDGGGSGGDNGETGGSGGGANKRRASDSGSYRHTLTSESISFTETQMRGEVPTEAMINYNNQVAKAQGCALEDRVRCVEPTPNRESAATIYASVLAGKSFKQGSVQWARGGGSSPNSLKVNGVGCGYGFENYGAVMGTGSGTAQQSSNTLRSPTGALQTMMDKCAELEKNEQFGFECDGFDIRKLAEDRLGDAFVIAYVFLINEMQNEVKGGKAVDQHGVNSANPFAKFGYHVDNHAEVDSPPGPYIEHSVVCQCSPGLTSMAVAGFGEIEYKGVGSFVIFPAWALHRTLRVEPSVDGVMWKFAGFFEG